MKNADKTHCPQGHKYTKRNTSKSPDGRRHCLRCQQERDKKRRGEELGPVEEEVLAAIQAWQDEAGTPAQSPYIRKRTGLGAVAVIKILAALLEQGLIFPVEIAGPLPMRGWFTHKEPPKLREKRIEETGRGHDEVVVSKQMEREGVPYTQTTTSRGGQLSLEIRS